MMIALSVATGILQILFIVGILASFVLVALVVGRAPGSVPACPRCFYCVEGLGKNICPECGLDLSQSGVHTHGRRRVSRWYRAIITVVIACFLFPESVRLTEQFWIDTSGDLLGRVDLHNGRAEGSIRLRADASSFTSVTAIYPDFSVTYVDDIQSMPPANLPTGDWMPPQPLRLMVRRNDGSGRDYLIEPTANAGWSVREVPEFLAYAEQNETEGRQTAKSQDELADMMAARIKKDLLKPDTQEVGPSAASQLLSGMMDHMMNQQNPRYTSEVMSSLGGNSMMSTIVRSSSNKIDHHWPAIGAWVLIWMLILTIVVIPHTPRSPWPPASDLNQ